MKLTNLLSCHPKVPASVKWCTYAWYVLLILVSLSCIYLYLIDRRPGYTSVLKRLSYSYGGAVSKHEESFTLALKSVLGPSTDIFAYTLLAVAVLYSGLGTRIRQVRLRSVFSWGIMLVLLGFILSILYLVMVLLGTWLALLPMLASITLLFVPGIILLVKSRRYHAVWQEVNLGAIDPPDEDVGRVAVPGQIRNAALVMAGYGLLCVLGSLAILGYWLETGTSRQNGKYSLMLSADTMTTNYFSFLSPIYGLHLIFSSGMQWSSMVFVLPQLICLTWGLMWLYQARQLYGAQLPTLAGLRRFIRISILALGVYTITMFLVCIALYMTMPNLLFPGSLVLLLALWMLRQADDPYAAMRQRWLEQQAIAWQEAEADVDAESGRVDDDENVED